VGDSLRAFRPATQAGRVGVFALVGRDFVSGWITHYSD